MPLPFIEPLTSSVRITSRTDVDGCGLDPVGLLAVAGKTLPPEVTFTEFGSSD
jgi:hypothetical protein